MKSLQSASWKFSLQLGLSCCPKDKNFWTITLAGVPMPPNQQGTFEMREVLSSVGAKDTDTSGYELSGLEDIEFSWEDPPVDMDSV